MAKLIGGLFGTQENANRAYQAVGEAGLTEKEISVFVPKPRASTARKMMVGSQR